MKLANWLLAPESRKPPLVIATILIASIAAAAGLTGKELRLGALYLFPVMLVSWQAGRAWGLTLSFLSTGLMILVAAHVGNPFSNEFRLYAYFGAILLCLILVTEAAAQLRDAFNRQAGKK